MPDFKFDEESHTYTLDGEVLPSVTGILRPLSNYGAVPPEVLEKARQRGSAVDLAVTLYARGELDEGSVDPRIAGYLNAYKQFERDFNPRWEMIQGRLYHADEKVAGTLDFGGNIRDARVILDVKATYAIENTVWPQTSAYDWLLESMTGLPADELWVLQLKKDGRYKYRVCERCDRPDHFETFLSCLRLYRAEREIKAWKDTYQ